MEPAEQNHVLQMKKQLKDTDREENRLQGEAAGERQN